MSDLTRRMMDAEAEANKDIAAKHYQHTASYAKLTGADVPRPIDTSSSGKSLHDQLLKRAHVKENMVANSYKESMLGTDSFRRAEFNDGDEKTRKKFLAKKAEDKRHHRKSNIDETQIRGYQKTGENNTQNKATSAGSEAVIDAPGSIKHVVKPSHKFSEPAKQRYNPYA